MPCAIAAAAGGAVDDDDVVGNMQRATDTEFDIKQHVAQEFARAFT